MQDRTRINTGEDYELRYWSEKFGVSQDRLKAAVQKVGNSVSAVSASGIWKMRTSTFTGAMALDCCACSSS
jgi:hypothetical protein